MARFIIVTFGFLAFAFYEMSGGSDFDAEATRLARIEAPVAVDTAPLEQVVVAEAEVEPVVPENVTRVALNLNTVNDVLRPQRTVRTTVARAPAAQAETTDVAALEEEPTVILPSLILGDAVITPVEFGTTETVTGDESLDVRAVSARSVNVRGGPGTDYSVVSRLTRGAQVEILQDPGNGWVKLRPLDGGTVGWMADFLLNKG